MFSHYAGLVRAVIEVVNGDLHSATERAAAYMARPLAMSFRLPVSEFATNCWLSVGDHERAGTALDVLDKCTAHIGGAYYSGVVAVLRATVAHAAGNAVAAQNLVRTVLPAAHEEGLRPFLITAVELLAMCASTAGQPHEAVRLAAAAEAERHRIGYRWRWPYQQRTLDAAMSSSRVRLGEDHVAIWSAGAADGLDVAIHRR
jgi:hypothetical protein